MNERDTGKLIKLYHLEVVEVVLGEAILPHSRFWYSGALKMQAAWLRGRVLHFPNMGASHWCRLKDSDWSKTCSIPWDAQR